MKKIAFLSIIALFTMCKTPSKIIVHAESIVEEENKSEEKSPQLNLPDFAQVRDDFRSVSDISKNKYLNGMNATDDNYSVIILTKGFQGENISIKNENMSFFEGMAMSNLKTGIAKSIRIDNNEDIVIHDTFTEGEIIIENEHAKLFKFIYIMKNNANKKEPFKVTFSNTLRPVR